MLSTLRPAATRLVQKQTFTAIAAAAQVARLSTWKDVKQGPPDAILGITEAFKADSFGEKINLGVGAYREPHCVNAMATER